MGWTPYRVSSETWMRAVASCKKGRVSHQLGVPSLAIDRAVEIVDQELHERIVWADPSLSGVAPLPSEIFTLAPSSIKARKVSVWSLPPSPRSSAETIQSTIGSQVFGDCRCGGVVHPGRCRRAVATRCYSPFSNRTIDSAGAIGGPNRHRAVTGNC